MKRLASPCAGAVRRDVAVAQQVHAAAVRADPQPAAARFGDDADRVLGQSVPRRVVDELQILQPRQAVVGADPDASFAIFRNDMNGVARQPFRFVELLEAAVAESHQAGRRGGDPHRAAAVFEEGVDVRRRRAGAQRFLLSILRCG